MTIPIGIIAASTLLAVVAAISSIVVARRFNQREKTGRSPLGPEE
jgi:hypothetical protein